MREKEGVGTQIFPQIMKQYPLFIHLFPLDELFLIDLFAFICLKWDILKIHNFFIFDSCPGKSIGLKFILSQSELFRFILISVSEAMRIIPNQSEKRFVSRLMKNGQKPIWLNPINSETLIRMNPNQSKPSFHGRHHSDLRFIRIDSDWKLGFGFIWIDVSELIGLSRIGFCPFFIKRDTKRFSNWCGMIRIGSDTDIGMNRNNSDWFGMNFNVILSPGFFSSKKNQAW